VEIKLRGVGALTLRPSDSDLATVRQVFSERQYELPAAQSARLRRRYEELLVGGKVPVIIDAGANVGAASLWFAKEYPDAMVLAVEPDADNVELCRRNTSRADRVRVCDRAIGSRPGYVSMVNKSAAWAIQTVRNRDADGTGIVTIAELMQGAGSNSALFLVKVDIEGFESDLFASNTGWIREAAAIYVEPHDWLFPGDGTSQSMQGALLGAGFELLIRGENLVFVFYEPARNTT
jgi:FkbM family methyltransferase